MSNILLTRQPSRTKKIVVTAVALRRLLELTTATQKQQTFSFVVREKFARAFASVNLEAAEVSLRRTKQANNFCLQQMIRFVFRAEFLVMTTATTIEQSLNLCRLTPAECFVFFE